jgi:hypothetical protein
MKIEKMISRSNSEKEKPCGPSKNDRKVSDKRTSTS